MPLITLDNEERVFLLELLLEKQESREATEKKDLLVKVALKLGKEEDKKVASFTMSQIQIGTRMKTTLALKNHQENFIGSEEQLLWTESLKKIGEQLEEIKCNVIIHQVLKGDESLDPKYDETF